MSFNIASALLEDFLTNQKNESCIHFFKKSTYSYVVLLIIIDYHVKSKKLTIDIIERSVERLTSRKTLFSFLDDAVKQNLILKTMDPNDKRRVIISPTEQLIEQFNKWSQRLVHKIIANNKETNHQ